MVLHLGTNSVGRNASDGGRCSEAGDQDAGAHAETAYFVSPILPRANNTCS